MVSIKPKLTINSNKFKLTKEMKEQVCQRFKRNIWLLAQLIEYLSYLGLIAIFAPFDNIVIKEPVHY